MTEPEMEWQSSAEPPNQPNQNIRRPRKRECPVCYSTLVTPIFQCYNGHLICSKCLPRLDSCPVCRDPYPPLGQKIRAREFEDLIQEFMVQCVYKDQGCPMILDIEDVQEHEANCDYQFMTTCKWCGVRLSEKLLGQHLTSVHKMSGLEGYKFGQFVDMTQSCFPWEFRHSLLHWGTHFLFCGPYKFYIKSEIHQGGKFIRWSVTFDHDDEDYENFLSTRPKLRVVIKLTRRESGNGVSTSQWIGYAIPRKKDRGFYENSFSIPLQQLEYYSLCHYHDAVDPSRGFPSVWSLEWIVSIKIVQEPTTTTTIVGNGTLNERGELMDPVNHDADELLAGEHWTLKSVPVYRPNYEYLWAVFCPHFEYTCPYRGLREFRNWTLSAALTFPIIYWLINNTKLVPHGSRLDLGSNNILLPKTEQVPPKPMASKVIESGNDDPIRDTKLGDFLIVSATIGALLGATAWKAIRWFRPL